MPRIDQLNANQKREYVVAAVVVGLVLSTLSLVFRVWARIAVIRKLRPEDWTMIAGLVFSYGAIATLLYGLNAGFAEPFSSLAFDRRREFLLSIWILQKIQPLALLIIKTSIIIFNAHIFQTRRFVQMSWAVWIFTVAWTLVAVLGTTFQCNPPSAFWNKKQKGKCVDSALRIVGLSSSIASCVSDIVILLMPVPLLLRLKVERRQRIGLIVVFMLGLFAVGASFVRWTILQVALGKGQVFNSPHIDVVVWTYLEISVGITCGNLPFLATLMSCIGSQRKSVQNRDSESPPILRQMPERPASEGTMPRPESSGDITFVLHYDEAERGTISLRAVEESVNNGTRAF